MLTRSIEVFHVSLPVSALRSGRRWLTWAGTAIYSQPHMFGLLLLRSLSGHRAGSLLRLLALLLCAAPSAFVQCQNGSKPVFEVASVRLSEGLYILPDGIRGKGITMQTLAAMLESPTERPILDQTGLAGIYNIELHYAPAGSTDSEWPPATTAIQEQLGLRLIPQQVTVQHLVVDQVNREPTQN